MNNKPGRGTTYVPWTREELDLLSSEWPKGGWRHVKTLFPNRSYSSICGKAVALQLRLEGSTYVKQEATEWTTAVIKRAYLNPYPDVKALAKSLNRTHGWVKYQARLLGVARNLHNAPWTPEEDALLTECLEKTQALNTVYKKFRAAGFQRTLNAISGRVVALNGGWQRGFYTANDLATLFAIEVHSVLAWIRTGKLKAKRVSGPSCQEQGVESMWAVTPKAVRTFMLEYPVAWDHRRLQKEVLLDLLCGSDHGLGAFKAVEAA